MHFNQNECHYIQKDVNLILVSTLKISKSILGVQLGVQRVTCKCFKITNFGK
jgi:hypothetical protein